ncbi:hypothetical protein IH992_04100 [Candidatus Poribacteria bacterium]|nr:hypothetical protein [Candidatus Poribacteria bacterium]
MSFILKIVVSILPVIAIVISVFVISRSSIVLNKVWREGIDFKATIQKVHESLTGQVNLIVLKNKMAIYKDNEIIALIQDEPSNVKENIMFSTIYHNEKIKELELLKAEDIIEFRSAKYKIISLGNPSRGHSGERIVNTMRNNVICEKIDN